MIIKIMFEVMMVIDIVWIDRLNMLWGVRNFLLVKMLNLIYRIINVLIIFKS